MVNVKKRKTHDQIKCAFGFYCTRYLYTYAVIFYCNFAIFQMIFIGWDEMKNCILVMRNVTPVSKDPCYPRVCWTLIITVSGVWPLGDKSVRTLVKILTFSKYFVGSGANSMHTHVVYNINRLRLPVLTQKSLLKIMHLVPRYRPKCVKCCWFGLEGWFWTLFW